jgi:hypothetical protein
MRRLTQRYYGSMMGRCIHKRIIGFPREAKFGKFYIECFHDEGQFELEDDSQSRSIYTTNNLNSRMSPFQSNEINAGAFWEKKYFYFLSFSLEILFIFYVVLLDFSSFSI